MNWNQIWEALAETLQMTLPSTLISYIIGLPLGVLLVITRAAASAPCPRSTRGRRHRQLFALHPLHHPAGHALPGDARGHGPRHRHRLGDLPPDGERLPLRGGMVEGSFNEVDNGIIEAAQSMGSSTFQIVRKVLIPEAMPSLINGFAICMTTILGYTAMASAAGGAVWALWPSPAASTFGSTTSCTRPASSW